MHKIIFLIIINLILISGCTGLPLRLKGTADQSMFLLNQEMDSAIESMNYHLPRMTAAYQIGENQWCLIYELGPEFYFSSLWEKQVQDWKQIEIRPYVDNCDWAHR